MPAPAFAEGGDLDFLGDVLSVGASGILFRASPARAFTRPLLYLVTEIPLLRRSAEPLARARCLHEFAHQQLIARAIELAQCSN